jgi:division protein CdvB (Snf7/Vps24/ESCRT-III family)
MTDFQKNWSQERKEPVGDAVRDAIFPPAPLKNRIRGVQQALNREITHLEAVDNRLRKKDADIMHEIVTASEKHDEQHASAHANELAETRKMMRLTSQTKTVLKQISLRIETVEEMGDLVHVMAPIIPVVRRLKGGIAGVMPNAGSAIGEIGDMMGSLLTDVGHITGYSMTAEPGGEDAEKILSEAMAVAEQKRMDKFPQVPTNNLNYSQTEQE